jgi:hypothetical protein
MIAKGSWQKDIWHDLKAGKVVDSPFKYIQGNASKYLSRYKESFANMLNRAHAKGYIVARIPGTRGGEYSAKYMIITHP